MAQVCETEMAHVWVGGGWKGDRRGVYEPWRGTGQKEQEMTNSDS